MKAIERSTENYFNKNEILKIFCLKEKTISSNARMFLFISFLILFYVCFFSQ